MIAKKSTYAKSTIWLMMAWGIPVVWLGLSSEYYAEPGVTRALIGAALGGAGAAVDFSMFMFTQNKPTKVKALSTLGWYAAVFGYVLTLHNVTAVDHATCEVCGYKAVEQGKDECKYCGSITWEKGKASGDQVAKEEWLRAEQLFWFRLDSLTARASFFHPIEDEGFQKDKDWKPVITQADLEVDMTEG